jgi:hypothetical protein
VTPDISYRSDFDVVLHKYMASDETVVQAARVSTQGVDANAHGELAGLIGFLMKNRHGSPFEHAGLWLDDSQVADLRIRRAPTIGGMVKVEVTPC